MKICERLMDELTKASDWQFFYVSMVGLHSAEKRVGKYVFEAAYSWSLKTFTEVTVRRRWSRDRVELPAKESLAICEALEKLMKLKQKHITEAKEKRREDALKAIMSDLC